ncbi:MAG: quinone oxidoreductase [Alphaproteobacteria bacterium HGW-Alphaproteobacteria-5]|nr:MAG: quinone oxidoreductase [Alphaproteobacteria bacterium HGW-Alphaproteobacteria-5]
MPFALRVHEFGGPDALRWEEIEPPKPSPGEVIVRNGAIGLNFLDVYYRSGRYPMPAPLIPGNEGAGIIEAVGPGVTDFSVGDRVGYIDPIGAYAELVARPVHRLVRLPDGIDERLAAASLLKGMTAEYLLRRTHKVEAGETILVHAAAGGVGQILCQWARHLGATVIGTVGSAAKQDIASKVGCDHVILLDETPAFAARVRELTDGRGVRVAYDGVGEATFAQSLDCIAPLGLLAAFGASSGPIPLLDVQSLAAKGSLFVTRPGIGTYMAAPEALQASASALFDVLATGAVKIDIGRTYALRDGAQAHADLEARRLTGSTLLLP